jgi:AcrR family transcriptional regulator
VTAAKKQTYHHGDLRAALMRAALSLIEENGVKGLNLSDAARLTGVSVAAPYRHFKDKEALLAAIAAEGFALFRDALASADGRLVEMGVAYVEFALEHPAHFKVMWDSTVPKDKAADQAYGLLAQAVHERLPGAPPDKQRALITAAWSIAHGYAALALSGELEAASKQKLNKKLLRQTLHLLVDQF